MIPCVDYIKSLEKVEYDLIDKNDYKSVLYFETDNEKDYYLCLEDLKYVSNQEQYSLEKSFSEKKYDRETFEKDIDALNLSFLIFSVKKDLTNQEISNKESEIPLNTDGNDNQKQEIQNNNSNQQTSTTDNSPKKTENNENKNNSNNHTITNNNNDSNNNSEKENSNNTSSNNESKKEPEESNENKVKTVCSDSNQDWLNYLNKLKAINPESLYFDTVNQAIEYGEYAAKKLFLFNAYK